MCLQAELEKLTICLRGRLFRPAEAVLLASDCRCPRAWWVEGDPPRWVMPTRPEAGEPGALWAFLYRADGEYFLVEAAPDAPYVYAQVLEPWRARDLYEELPVKWAAPEEAFPGPGSML